MLTCFQIEGGKLSQAADNAGPVWLFIAPTEEDKARLTGPEFNLDAHSLNSALDPDELPRLELETDHLVVIFKYPKRFLLHDKYDLGVQSLGLFLYADRLVIVSREDDQPAFEGRPFTKIDSLQTLFLRIISKCIQHFYSHLKAINELANELEPKIMSAMENRNLLLMFAIEKSLVYYVNAMAANGRTIDRLRTNARNAATAGLTPEQLEYVDDLYIENAQCHEQAQIYANVLAGLMDARASIVNNNLNVLIKRLTILSVVFLPLNVVASIGGMSEYTKVTEAYAPWWVTYPMFCLGLAAVGWVTYQVLKVFERRKS
ncbi:MAG: magnesium transporter CorA family protein [Planctomycetaceae bacterium]|nr:magnesium transporter CorA family protein [Planctomycetaceae bacterium]